VPIMRHLALRKYAPAMVVLAAWLSDSGLRSDLGSPATGHCAAGLYHRAWRSGEANAAQHMAMSCFNLNDLAGYRLWLRRAAKLGETNCAIELRHFRLRQPTAAARKIRRLRPSSTWD